MVGRVDHQLPGVDPNPEHVAPSSPASVGHVDRRLEHVAPISPSSAGQVDHKILVEHVVPSPSPIRNFTCHADCKFDCENPSFIGGRVEWDPVPSFEEKIATARKREMFRQSLTPAEVANWKDNHRLGKIERDTLLAAMDPDEVERRGFRFSDEPVSSPPEQDGSRAKMRAAVAANASPFVGMHAQNLLMDGWNLADPLALELVADIVTPGRGVNLGYNGPRDFHTHPSNRGSAKMRPAALAQVVDNAIDKGHMAGWFPSMPYSNCVTCPLALVPKPNAVPPWRLIHDTSPPLPIQSRLSLTELSDKVQRSYQKFDDAVDQFKKYGRGCWGIGGDKKNAFPSLPLRESDRHLTCIHVPGKGWAHGVGCLFGLPASGFRFEDVGELFTLLLDKVWEVPDMSRWVDDFNRICAQCYYIALQILQRFTAAARRYGFLLHGEKLILARIWRYHGIIFDAIQVSLAVPQDKINKAINALKVMLGAKQWLRSQFRHMCGIVFYLSRLWHAWRGFLGRSVNTLHHGVFPIDRDDWEPEVILDMEMMHKTLTSWSGVKLLKTVQSSSLPDPDIVIDVDTSGRGIGLVCRSTRQWGLRRLTPEQIKSAYRTAGLSSPHLEAIGMIVAEWSIDIRDKVVLIRNDCSPAIKALKSRFSTEPHMSDAVRMFSYTEMNFNALIILQDVPRDEIAMADALSKLDVPRFKRLALAEGFSPKASPVKLRFPPMQSWSITPSMPWNEL